MGAGKVTQKVRPGIYFSFKAKPLQETISMMNYGKLKCARFSLTMSVLLLIVIVMTMVSGCSSEDSQNISGQITAGGSALSGVTITMTGAISASATTDTNGNYTFGSIQSGTVILTPSLTGYTFSPLSRTVLLLGVDLAGLNFSSYFSGQLATSYHTVYRKNNGTVWTWGNNSNGQLGDGTTTDRATPMPVSGLAGVSAVAAGSAHSVALKNDGTVWAWGSNSKGQLGNGTTTDRSTPVQVSTLVGITAVAAGASHSIALRNIVGVINDGTIWAWGSNSNGQLGNGTTVDTWIPIQVSGLTGVTAIAAGSAHTVAVRNIFSLINDGTLWAWGSNGNGQLGNGTTTDSWTPVMVSGLSLMTTIAAGFNHTIALMYNGVIWTWGNNSNGQLGDGTTTERWVVAPISGLTGVMAIAAGTKNNIVLRNDNTLQAWGYNNKGQLGDGTTTDKLTPVLIP
jgi:alpha-tubulin suppressor-like RCC1 family protein